RLPDCSYLSRHPHPPKSTLFPYTTLFRSRGVQRGARPHRGRRLGGIGQVVPAHVDRLALCADQLAIDLGLALAERLGQRFEAGRSEEHTSELQSRSDLVCRLLLEKKKSDV